MTEDDFKAASEIKEAAQSVRFCSLQEAQQFWEMFKRAMAEYEQSTLSPPCFMDGTPLKKAAE